MQGHALCMLVRPRPLKMTRMEDIDKDVPRAYVTIHAEYNLADFKDQNYLPTSSTQLPPLPTSRHSWRILQNER